MRPLSIRTRRDFYLMLSAAQKKTDDIVAATGWDVAVSIKSQLDFIANCAKTNTRPTENEASRINLGQLAMRNLEESDPQYADWLMELGYAFLDNWDALK